MLHQIALFNDTLAETNDAQGNIEIVDLEADELIHCAFIDLVGDENNSQSPSGEATPNSIEVFYSDKDSSVEKEIVEKTVTKPKVNSRNTKRQRKCLRTKGRKKQQRKFSSFKGFSEVGAKFVKIKHQVKRAKSKKQVRFADKGERA